MHDTKKHNKDNISGLELEIKEKNIISSIGRVKDVKTREKMNIRKMAMF